MIQSTLPTDTLFSELKHLLRQRIINLPQLPQHLQLLLFRVPILLSALVLGFSHAAMSVNLICLPSYLGILS
jgi:riboflavin transporter FmnP